MSRTIFTNATIVTMDPDAGVLTDATLVVREDRIEAVTGSAVAAGPGDRTIDASRKLVMPGFVDTHRHCWQTPFRRHIPDVNDMAAYLDATHNSLALAYEPRDMYLASYVGALGALDCGITSLVDFSHNSRTAAHSDAAIRGLADSGIRGTHAYGPALAGEWSRQWPGDLARAVATAETTERVTVRLAAQGSAHYGGEYVRLSEELIGSARAHGVGVSVDGIIGAAASDLVEELGDARALGSDVTLIHCQGLSERAWDTIADTAAAVSLTVTSDAQIGIGDCIPPIEQCLDRGIEPSLSVDVETVLAGDMFTQMRVLLSIQRMLAVRAAAGSGSPARRIQVSDVLRYATRGGASANGHDGVVGVLAPGAKADIVVIGTDRAGVFPVTDPVGTIVSGVDSGDVEAVMVDGVFRKEDGRLCDVDLAEVRRDIEASRARIVAARP